MSVFKEKVIEVVNLVPYGKVVSYGQVAIMAGIPRAARQVGGILNRLENGNDVPWWRVVNNSGRISIKGSTYSPDDQKSFLESEGLNISDDYAFDINKYRFIPDINLLRKIKLDDEYIDLLVARFSI